MILSGKTAWAVVLPFQLIAAFAVRADDWPQWRGPNRDNIASDTGLAKRWPEKGPPLQWRVSGLGSGISPPSLAGGQVIVLSQYETTEYVRVIDETNGKHLWTTLLGESPQQSLAMRWLTQRPVTIDGERLYAVTVLGELACLRTSDGTELWRKNYATEFAGQRGVFGYSDCPVVYEGKVICTPGGREASIVALDKQNGTVLWRCAVAEAGQAAYGNGILAEIGGRKQFITFFEKALVGVAVDDGQLLWQYEGVVDRYNHPHTPLVYDDAILCLNAFGPGAKLLKLEPRDGVFNVKEVYSVPNNRISRLRDHTIRLKDRLYECENGIFACFEWNGGNIVWAKRIGQAGAATYADGHFFLHDLAGMTAALVDVADEGPVEVSRFTLPQISGGISSPIIAGGHLYFRKDDQLLCYDVREDATPLADERQIVALPAVDPRANGKAFVVNKERLSDALFVPTPQNVVDKMLVLARVTKDDVVYDLGSGDGRIVIEAANKYGCRAVGLEIKPDLLNLSRERATQAKVDSLATFKEADLFSTDFQEATVVAAYLFPQLLERLLPKFDQLKPGTRIVTHQFQIPGRKPEATITVDSQETGERHTVYLWKVPLHK